MMAKDDLISIIVPIYRVEAYFPRCINSLLAQTCRNLELILVDDGSPDGCGEICDEYAAKDNRIKVIHKENGGLSDARNAGIAVASGSYIAFVDSDDWVAADYLERMYAALTQQNADICECGIIPTCGESVLLGETTGATEMYETEAALKELILDKRFHQHVWNKLYRRSCIEGILFEKGRTNEDEFWTYQVFGRAKRIVRIESKLYYYFQRPESIMGARYGLRRLDALEAKSRRQSYVEKYFPKLADMAQVNLFESCIYAGQMSMVHLRGNERKQAKEIIDRIQRKSRPTGEQMQELRGTQKLWDQLGSFSFWGTVWVKNLLRKGF